jgi:hypothetical protein
MVRDGARWCEMVRDGASGARWCEMVGDGANLPSDEGVEGGGDGGLGTLCRSRMYTYSLRAETFVCMKFARTHY